jgi:protein-tyrosine kinase
MNIIEQAAKRIEELRRAGVDVPWAAAGFKDGERDALLSGQAAAGAQKAESSPFLTAVPSAGAAAAPVGDKASVVPILRDEAVAAPILAPVAAPAAMPEETDSKPARRSKTIELDLDRLAQNGYLVPGLERSQMEEQFRIVKRPLLKNAAGDSAAPIDRANLIMVTSALPGEGKTFTAINLAMSIAMELDHTVLLVDADVVRPSVLDRLGVRASKGLLDVLTNPEIDLSDVMLKTSIPKLTILPAGTANSRTTELLASGAMENLLDELAQSYDDRIIIFDAPPLLPSTESRVLATHVGQVVVVVESDRTHRSSVTQAFAALEACPVVMSVLNKCRGKLANSAYGYYAA